MRWGKISHAEGIASILEELKNSLVCGRNVEGEEGAGEW